MATSAAITIPVDAPFTGLRVRRGGLLICAGARVVAISGCRGGRFKEADPLLLASQQGFTKAPIPNLARLGKQRLVELYDRWGKPADPQKMRAKT